MTIYSIERVKPLCERAKRNLRRLRVSNIRLHYGDGRRVGAQSGQPQVLTLVKRDGPTQWRESQLDRVFFVPLKSGVI